MSSPLDVVLDALEEARELLAEQYRNQPNFDGVLTIIARQFQELETATHDLIDKRSVDTAVGVTLGVLERIVGQRQFVFSDDEVRRAWIKARILLNRGSGTADDILRVFIAVLTAGLTPEISERFPAALELRVAGGPLGANLVPALAQMLQIGKAAGIGASLLYTLSPSAEVLRFAATVAFLSAPLTGGELQFDVNGVTGTFPPGPGPAIRLGFGANAEEFTGYDGFDGTEFSIDGYGTVANAHEVGEEVLLLPRRVGFGDASSLGGGGKFGGVA